MKPTITRAALAHLASYPFPGNVRELENLLHRAVALSGGELIDVLDLGLPDTAFADFESAPSAVPQAAEAPEPMLLAGAAGTASFAVAHEPLPSDLARHLDAVERDILERALERHRYNRTAAGASLGLSLRQMRYRMARLGISVESVGGDRE